MEDFNWLKFKKYPHIGKPLDKKKDSGWIKKYVSNPGNISKHKFTPLIHRTISQRKFRPVKNAKKNIDGKRVRTVKNNKQRHIFFASHLDSIIYSYYSHILTNAYEKFLKDKPYRSAAVAYRKIPLTDRSSGNKSNIDFAYEAFEFIEQNKDRDLSIIVADITSFFDNLDHRLLHSQWKRILHLDDLPNDHYAVYKSLIAKRYVNENELFARFQNKMLVERYRSNDTTQKEIKRKAVKKIYNLKKEKVVAFCEKDEFFEHATDLIRVDRPLNKSVRKSLEKAPLKGIPQGTPMSASLANIYMLDFDQHIHNEATQISKKAFYQRYSDDIIIICDRKDEKYFYNLIRLQIEKEASLNIQHEKTKVYRYGLNSDSDFNGGILANEVINTNNQLEYLGFTYNGSKIFVKTAAFSKFYRTMKRSFRRGAFFAKQAHTPSNALFEKRLYKRFTHVGSKRRLKWLPDPSSPTGYNRSEQYDWGNFISYLNKANTIMNGINKDDTIAKQYRKIWRKFHVLKTQTYDDIKKNS